MTVPRRQWGITYSYLREGAPWYEVETLEGFFVNCLGGLNSFLYRDEPIVGPSNTIIGGPIGIGDGVTTAFQAVREQVGGYLEPGSGGKAYTPVFCFDKRAAYSYYGYTRSAGQPCIAYKNGVAFLDGSGVLFNAETGVITFSVAPASGVVITADFSYGYRVRFVDDNIDIDSLVAYFNEMKLIKVIESRV